MMDVEWIEGEIAGGKGTFGVLDSGLTIAFFRQRDGSVWFSAALPAGSLTFDPYRMPLLWVDDALACDAGLVAEMSRQIERTITDSNDPPMPIHMVGDTVVAFQLWHGVEAKGLGCVRALLEGRRLSFRYFVLPHDSIDVNVRLVGLPPLLRHTLGLSQT